MRTTLDLDDRVLAAARAKVHAGLNKSLGEAVSAMALEGLEGLEGLDPSNPGAAKVAPSHGLVLIDPAPGHVITDEMVAEALLDE